MQFSKFVVTLVIIMNIIFAFSVLFIFFKIGSEPTTLIAAWFAFTTGELWTLAGIKKKELDIEEKEGDKNG